MHSKDLLAPNDGSQLSQEPLHLGHSEQIVQFPFHLEQTGNRMRQSEWKLQIAKESLSENGIVARDRKNENPLHVMGMNVKWDGFVTAFDALPHGKHSIYTERRRSGCETEYRVVNRAVPSCSAIRYAEKVSLVWISGKQKSVEDDDLMTNREAAPDIFLTANDVFFAGASPYQVSKEELAIYFALLHYLTMWFSDLCMGNLLNNRQCFAFDEMNWAYWLM